MENVEDQSFGVVPVIKRNGEWRVLLVHQISYRGSDDRFWTFPKGHAEGEETAIETAKRELLEETGVTDVQINQDAAFRIKYTFTHEQKRIKKQVTYFLGICGDTKTLITIPEEIADLKWCSFKEAAKKIAHKNVQKVLLEAATYINTHNQLI